MYPKYYDLFVTKASIDRTPSGKFLVTIKHDVEWETTPVRYIFTDEADALKEILSYAETNKDSFEMEEE